MRADGDESRVAAGALEEAVTGAARRIRARLATRTGQETAVRVAEVAPVRELAARDVALWCRFTREGGEAFVSIDDVLLGWLVGSLLGVSDGGLSWRPRGGTEVERAFGARFCRELMESLDACWPRGPAPGFAFAGVGGRAESDEGFVAATLEIGESKGRLVLYVPTSVLRTLCPSPVPPPAPDRAPRFDRVMPLEVPLVVELARLVLPLRQLRQLRVGDELPLGALTEATARIGDVTAFVGEAGTRGSVCSFRVARRAGIPSTPGKPDR